MAPALGLVSLPLSDAPEWADPSPLWWKLPAAQRVIDSGRRLIWTDDQFPLYRTDPRTEPGLRAVELSGLALLLGPDPDTGLSPGDLRRIAAFLALCAAAGARRSPESHRA